MLRMQAPVLGAQASIEVIDRRIITLKLLLFYWRTRIIVHLF